MEWYMKHTEIFGTMLSLPTRELQTTTHIIYIRNCMIPHLECGIVRDYLNRI